MFFVLWISEISLPLFITTSKHDLVVTFHHNIWLPVFRHKSIIRASITICRDISWYNNICKINGFLHSSKGEDLLPWFSTIPVSLQIDMYIKINNNLLNNIHVYPLYQLMNYEILLYIHVEHNKHYNCNNCTIEKTFKIHVTD